MERTTSCSGLQKLLRMSTSTLRLQKFRELSTFSAELAHVEAGLPVHSSLLERRNTLAVLFEFDTVPVSEEATANELPDWLVVGGSSALPGLSTV